MRRTEPGLPAAPMELLLVDPDLIAICKPAGIPVHHAGRYRRNTVVEILPLERPELELCRLMSSFEAKRVTTRCWRKRMPKAPCITLPVRRLNAGSPHVYL